MSIKYTGETGLIHLLSLIKSAIAGKADKSTATTSADGLMSASDKTMLDSHDSSISTLTGALKEVGAAIAKLTTVNTVTLSADGWEDSANGYSYLVTVTGMTADSYPTWYLSGVPSEAEYEAFCCITAMETGTDSAEFTCVSEKPSVDITIVIKGI